jgi:hypothetical protein|tara:strand:- start:140 stop:397 length:258 start_codon:yes stop_codon:yes gene_type:complete
MDADEHNSHAGFEIGDVVTETYYIVPPGRKPWTGIVVFIDKNYYELNSYLGQHEDLVAVHWFQPGYVETLPASVVSIVQRVSKEK